MKRAYKLFLVLFTAIASVFAYSVLFGKLFPYSPIVIGFARNELDNAIVYTQPGAEFMQINEIDQYIPLVERFHALEFKTKPRIFLFADERTYARRSLSKARFCAFYNGAIVVSPWAQREANDGIISMEIYLRHELSHSLLFQHAGLFNSMRYPKWLLEGIAVYSTGQMGTSWYPSKTVTYEAIRSGNFLHPQDYHTKAQNRAELDVPNRIAFIYSEFGCLVDNLINTYGMERFHSYMIELLSGEDHDVVFCNVFEVDFAVFIDRFLQMVSKSAFTA